jgi:hypothetical protein
MGLSVQIDELFVTLQNKLQNEISFQQQLFELLVCFIIVDWHSFDPTDRGLLMSCLLRTAPASSPN